MGPPLGDEEISAAGFNPIDETPFPSTSGRPSVTLRAHGASLPPRDGDAPSAQEEEEMEVDVTFDGNIGASGLEPKNQDMDEDRRKQQYLIAMIEGVCERIMDRRMGDPVPSYAQKKMEEKAQRGRPGHPTAGTSTPTVAAKRVRRTAKEIKPSFSSSTAIKNPSTTLNPPARPVKPRIISVETLPSKPPKILPPANQSGKRGEGGGGEEKEEGSKTTTGIPKKEIATGGEERQPQDQTWSQVVSRKAARKAKGPAGGTKPGENKGAAQPVPQTPQTGKKQTKLPSNKRREPKMAAVTVTCPPGQYTTVMRLGKR